MTRECSACGYRFLSADHRPTTIDDRAAIVDVCPECRAGVSDAYVPDEWTDGDGTDPGAMTEGGNTDADTGHEVRTDGGLSTRTLRVGPARTVAYGPAGANSGEWALRFTTDDGERVTVRLDEPAMYELWTEVHNVPWPNREDDRHDLQREIVARAERADAETLRDTLEVLGGDPA